MRPQYLLSLLLPAVVIAGNLGYAWPGAGIGLALFAYPLLDLLLGERVAVHHWGLSEARLRRWCWSR